MYEGIAFLCLHPHLVKIEAELVHTHKKTQEKVLQLTN